MDTYKNGINIPYAPTDQETIARQKAEEELERLREQLAHLQART